MAGSFDSGGVVGTTGSGLELDDGDRVAIIGGGPAGALFSTFFLDMADRIGLEVTLDIYEPRDFTRAAPGGCNMCGGIVSESLVQMLAGEGINLPPSVVQRGIEAYVLYTGDEQVRIATPLQESRIAAIHRGSGPKGDATARWESFDGYLLEQAVRRGARVVRDRVGAIGLDDGRPVLTPKKGEATRYDLVVGAVGVNSPALKLFEGLGLGYAPPRTTKTLIREYHLGIERINEFIGNAMHVFLLDIPRLKFAAIIPKGEYVTVCLLGDDIDREMLQRVLDEPQVRGCFPPDWDPDGNVCQCAPKINVGQAATPYGDRYVLVGDSAASRLYKDGIGAAYRTAKAAANTAIFKGISAADFEAGYRPVCDGIDRDNAIGKLSFMFTGLLQKSRFGRRAIVNMTAREQAESARPKRMSSVLWDMFTGSASYGEVFRRMLQPGFLGRFSASLALSPFTKPDR